MLTMYFIQLPVLLEMNYEIIKLKLNMDKLVIISTGYVFLNKR